MEKLIIIDIAEQTVTAKQGSKLFHKCECVLGRLFYRTPKGRHFKIEKKYPTYSSRKYNTRMDKAMFFTTTGEALHQYHGDIDWDYQRAHQAVLGSHGCVRLKEADARKLYSWAEEITTKVWVI